MSQKLGIKIEGPAPISIAPPLIQSLPKKYGFLLSLSLLFLILGLGMLVSDVFNPKMSQQIYQSINSWFPIHF